MMHLKNRLWNIYPELQRQDFLTVIDLQDDGDGPFIARWEHPTLPRPTDAQIAAASDVLAPKVDDVRAEAQRRIIALTGTTDIIGCLIKQHNAQMRATELTLIQAQGGTWTAEQAAEAAALQGLADAIKAIRMASNVLEVMDPIPTNYADNSLWP